MEIDMEIEIEIEMVIETHEAEKSAEQLCRYSHI